MEDESWDVLVIGGGVAGLSAALMLGRARRRVLVIDSGSPRNRFASHMHGVLGNERTDPAELLERGRAEAAAYGVRFEAGDVERVDEVDAGVRVAVAGGRRHAARAVIVATGLTDELPAIPGLARRWGRSVLHCPYCHGWEVRDQRLGVLTTSPLGLHQAELIRQWSDRVTVFTAGLGAVEPSTEQRLRARGIDLVAAPVTEILGDGDRIAAVRTEDGGETEVDAIFTAGTLRPHDGFLAHLDLDRADGPMGSFLAVDAMGRTSSDRIWAAGNVVNPGANVPMAIGAGTAVGAVVNAALVAEDFDLAIAGAAVDDPASGALPADYWEQRYADTRRVWSGAPNATMAEVVSALPPGRVLDLGCGEGADVIWLAQHGWTATGLDISPTAVERAAAAATAAGLTDGQARFRTADLSDLSAWSGDGGYDLVTASFFQSPVALDRTDILRRAAGLVEPGGHLLIVSHADAPPSVQSTPGHDHRFPTPEEEVAALDLPSDEWTTLLAETRTRAATGSAAAEHTTLDDVVVLVTRV